MSKKGGFGKFLTGVCIGAGIGVLFAPKKGEETRRELKEKLDELLKKAKELDMEEVKEEFQVRVYQIKKELADLDKERVLSIAKQKAGELKELTEELVDYAVKNGTPVLEKTANSVREKAIVVTKDVLTKLEKQDKEEKTSKTTKTTKKK